MTCWRIGLRRDFALYLNGELEPGAVKRVEDHLLDCGPCRTRLARLRNGHRLARELPRFKPQLDSWAAIEAALEAREPINDRARAATGWRQIVFQPGFALAVIGIVALIAGMLIAFAGRSPGDDRALMAQLDLGEFHAVNIAHIEQNTKPHVVAEGYVSEVHINDEDGDLSFKLVDDLGRAGPFIVCEIIDPIRLAAPAVGSRVRVYGVSRYDSQDNHNWYEVHPVLNIELVR